MGFGMKAYAQYSDYEGTSSIDWQGGPSDFFSLCRELKIDTDKYQPVGISVFYADRDFFNLSIFVKEKDKAINEKGEYPLLCVGTNIKAKKFFQYAKRLSIHLFDKNINEDEYYQEKEIDIDELPH